jgi:hypothetical protein
MADDRAAQYTANAARKPWIVELTCCGQDNGIIGTETWEDADEAREAYLSGPAVKGPDSNWGHERSAIIKRGPDAVPSTSDEDVYQRAATAFHTWGSGQPHLIGALASDPRFRAAVDAALDAAYPDPDAVLVDLDAANRELAAARAEIAAQAATITELRAAGPCGDRLDPIFASAGPLSCELTHGHDGGHRSGATTWTAIAPESEVDSEVETLRTQLAEAQLEATKLATEGRWVEHYAVDTPEGRRWYSRDRLPADAQVVAWRQAWEGPAQAVEETTE